MFSHPAPIRARFGRLGRALSQPTRRQPRESGRRRQLSASKTRAAARRQKPSEFRSSPPLGCSAQLSRWAPQFAADKRLRDTRTRLTLHLRRSRRRRRQSQRRRRSRIRPPLVAFCVALICLIDPNRHRAQLAGLAAARPIDSKTIGARARCRPPPRVQSSLRAARTRPAGHWLTWRGPARPGTPVAPLAARIRSCQVRPSLMGARLARAN